MLSFVTLTAILTVASWLLDDTTSGGGGRSTLVARASTAESERVPLSSTPYSKERKKELGKEVKRLFMHGYTSYMKHAFPMDELKPISCVGHNDFGGYSLTLVDSLDTLVLFGEEVEFMKRQRFVAEEIDFTTNRKVSVFETTIRVLGSLISSHYIAERLVAKYANRTHLDNGHIVDRDVFSYDGGLLRAAVRLADRLIGAFDTPTGIAFNEINLMSGVDRAAGHTTCPAGAGSLVLEFSALAALTGNCTYHTLAHRSLMGVWKHRSRHHLVGTMIDILNGRWGNSEATIGASVDSFYEYIFKGYVALASDQYYDTWITAYRAVQRYMLVDGWYLSSSLEFRGPLEQEHRFNSLQMFWPGLQVLAGDIPNAIDSYERMHCVTRHHGLPPEYCHIDHFARGQPEGKRSGPGYPLRPEFIESTYFLHRATQDDLFLTIGEEFLRQLKKTERACGFSAVLDVYQWTMEDKMDSFVLAETFKYLYLLFADDDDHDGSVDLFTKQGDWLVNTEAHPLPVTELMQQIPTMCNASLRETKLMTTDLRLTSDDYTYHAASEYVAEHRNEAHFDERKICPKYDYMLDIAPLLDNVRANTQRCGTSPNLRTPPLVHKEHHNVNKHVPHHHPDGSSGGGGGSGAKTQRPPDANANQQTVHYEVQIPVDPLDSSSGGLSFVLTIHKLAPQINIETFRGIVSLTNIRNPNQSLFMAGSAVGTRLFVAPADREGTDDPATVDEASSQEQLAAQTTTAQFGPALCAAGEKSLGLTLSGAVVETTQNFCPKTGTARDVRSRHPAPFSPSDLPRDPMTGEPLTFGIVIPRGGCTFKEKILAAQRMGASFAIIGNNQRGGTNVMADVDLPKDRAQVTIPSVLISVEEVVELRRLFILAKGKPEKKHIVKASFTCVFTAEEQFAKQGVQMVVPGPEHTIERPDRVLLLPSRFSPLVDVLYFREDFAQARAQAMLSDDGVFPTKDGHDHTGRLTVFPFQHESVCRHCRLIYRMSGLHEDVPPLRRPVASDPHSTWLRFVNTKTATRFEMLLERVDDRPLHYDIAAPQGAVALLQLQFTQRKMGLAEEDYYFSHPPPAAVERERVHQLKDHHGPGASLPDLDWGVIEVRTFLMDPVVSVMDQLLPQVKATNSDAESSPSSPAADATSSSTGGSWSSRFSDLLTSMHEWAARDGVDDARLIARYFGQEQITTSTTAQENEHGTNIGRYVEILIFETEEDRVAYRDAEYHQHVFHKGHLLQDQREMFELMKSSTVDVFNQAELLLRPDDSKA